MLYSFVLLGYWLNTESNLFVKKIKINVQQVYDVCMINKM